MKLGPGAQLATLLARAGATAGDAARADALIASTNSLRSDADTELTIFLGDKAPGGARRLEQLALRPALDRRIAVTRQADTLVLAVQAIAVDATPLRMTGRVGDGLFWSLRAAGASPEIAETYVGAVATRLGSIAVLDPDDRFDVIVERRRTTSGESEFGALQYIGLDRRSGPDLKLVRWSSGADAQWLAPDQSVGRSARLALPLAGEVTSRFGFRVHPLFRTLRFHKGVDLGASWGTPVRAAADGMVSAAGWSGGHGLRVRLAHDAGLTTSYSHLSRAAVVAGRQVRRGDFIGYVGSTGFSTGAHLHFELARNGQVLDPLGAGAGLASAAMVSDADRAALRARLAQLQAVPAS